MSNQFHHQSYTASAIDGKSDPIQTTQTEKPTSSSLPSSSAIGDKPTSANNIATTNTTAVPLKGN